MSSLTIKLWLCAPVVRILLLNLKEDVVRKCIFNYAEDTAPVDSWFSRLENLYLKVL